MARQRLFLPHQRSPHKRCFRLLAAAQKAAIVRRVFEQIENSDAVMSRADDAFMARNDLLRDR
jgi:hypothetical protein